eukprot:CAMPEP_0172380460 /NCGR_PEP_ID=MMETSP1060-20121228/70448_1 /TAXON_ID=37318 /ORGANISM="Pseudo-nitzschia pungens, Strain cf. cingulata" /LENGTH=870 /DNA_ID=CAMNT_0013108213 /DNA_START=214 /DNA_END=2826 /DNA_ORIENTATION=+
MESRVRCPLQGKHTKINRRRLRTVVLSSCSNLCLLFLIVSHLVLLNTLIVPVVAVVESEDHDNRIASGEQEVETILSPGNSTEAERLQEEDANDSNTTIVDVDWTDESNVEMNSANSNESDEEEKREISNNNLNSNNITGSDSSPTIETDGESNLEDESEISSGKTAKSKKVELEEVEKKKTMEGTIKNPLAANDNDLADVLSSKKNIVIEEAPDNDQQMINSKDGEEVVSASFKSPSEKTSKSKPQEVEKKREMAVDSKVKEEEVKEDKEKKTHSSLGDNNVASEVEYSEKEKETKGDESSPIEKDDATDDNTPESASTISSVTEDVQDETAMEGGIDDPNELQEDAQEEESKEADNKKSMNVEDDASSSTRKSQEDTKTEESKEADDEEAEEVGKSQEDAEKEESKVMDDKKTESAQDDASSSTTKTEDTKTEESKEADDEEAEEVGKSQEDAEKEESKVMDDKKTESAQDDASSSTTKTEDAENIKRKYPLYESSDSNDDSVIDLDVEDGIDTSNTDFTQETEDKATVSSNEIIDEKSKNETIVEMKDESGADEVPSASQNYSYQGEPWGQYRSTRRLPDMELLRLVFENSKNGDASRSNGDSKSQDVLKNWQSDPLYDENITKEEGLPLEEPLFIDDKDFEFEEYRSRLLGRRDASDSVPDTGKKVGDESKKDENRNKTVEQSNGSNNNVAANAEFVEGLDDIDDFFEGVNPPDELDVGYGSSIQDVLMDKGKHILLKKVRGVARWIQVGWERIGRNLEERISQFQLPFQKVHGTVQKAPDLDSSTAKSSSTSKIAKDTNVETGPDLKGSIVAAWKKSKQAFDQMSDWVDGFLDQFDKSEDDSTNFDDFNGFDLDNLSKLTQPQPS